MARTTINFEYEGKEYTLGFTVSTLKKLEKSGFSFGNIDDHILTATEDLFMASFDAKHPMTPKTLRKEIYEAMANAEEEGEISLGDVLLEMVSEAIDEMKPQGNLNWKVMKG